MSARFVSHVKQVKNKLDTGTRKGLFLAANDLKNASQRLAPVDTGFLRSSIQAHVGPDNGLPKGTAVVGVSARYARAVHELHPTGSKFLETPAKNMAEDLKRTIADEIRKAMS